MMNGYDLGRKMKQVRMRYKLSCQAQALYHELIDICNTKRWPEVFSCSNAALCKALHISEPTLQKARLALINAGLILYSSGKTNRTPSEYSFTTEENNLTTQIERVVTTKKETDYIKQNNKNLSPLSPKGRQSVRKRLEFNEIKDKLLDDYVWRQHAAKRLFLSNDALTDDQINIFLSFIVITGDEHTLTTIREAKRRFYCWWRKHGKNYAFTPNYTLLQ